MSDESPPPNPFAGLFVQPTPEERLERLKKREVRLRAALPHIRAARASLRELNILGFKDFADMPRNCEKAQNHLALLEEHVESALAWLVEP